MRVIRMRQIVRWRWVLAVLGITGVSLAIPLPGEVGAVSCGDGAYPPSGTNVTITPSSPVAGQSFTVSGTGFYVNRTGVIVRLSLGGQNTTTTNGSGVLIATTLAAPTTIGANTILISDNGSPAISCTIPITIVAATTTTTTTTSTTTTTIPRTTTTTRPTTTTTRPTTTTTRPATTTTTRPATTTTTAVSATTTSSVATTTSSVSPTTSVAGATSVPATVVPDTVAPTTTSPTGISDPLTPVIVEAGQSAGDGSYTAVVPTAGEPSVRLSATGLAPNSQVGIDVRVVQRVHEAYFATDPFDPDEPYDMSNFVIAEEFGLTPSEPTIGVLPELPESVAFVGGAITGATIVDLEQLGLTFQQLLAGLETNAIAFPRYFRDDPVLLGAVRWFLFDIVVDGATPNTNFNVYWYSIPIELARTTIDANGRARLQAAVPESMVTTGEIDTLRLIGVYPGGTAIADANGELTGDIVLSDDILAIGEDGSFASVLLSGINPDGSPNQGTIDVPLELLGKRAGVPPLVWVAVAGTSFGIPVILVLLLLRRRRSAEPVLIVGAGDTGVRLLRSLFEQRRPRFLPVALVEEGFLGVRGVDGVPVRGDIDDIPTVAGDTEATTVIVAMPDAPATLRQRILELAERAGLSFFAIPADAELPTEKKVVLEDDRGERTTLRSRRVSGPYTVFAAIVVLLALLGVGWVTIGTPSRMVLVDPLAGPNEVGLDVFGERAPVLRTPGSTERVENMELFLPREALDPVGITVDGVRPASEVEVNLRIVQKVHTAIFEWQDGDPFGSDSPYDVSRFVTASDFGLEPVTPVLGAPTIVDGEFVGGVITGAGIVDAPSLGLGYTDVLDRLSVNASPLPLLMRDDELLITATRWFLFDVSIDGAVPGTTASVYWYSVPVELARAEIGPDGRATFHAAVPDTFVSKGETDTLRIIAVYPTVTAAADSGGRYSSDFRVPESVLNIAERGSYASVLARVVTPDGAVAEQRIDVPVDQLRSVERNVLDLWWLLVLFLLLLLIALLVILVWRRRREEREKREAAEILAAANGVHAHSERLVNGHAMEEEDGS